MERIQNTESLESFVDELEKGVEERKAKERRKSNIEKLLDVYSEGGGLILKHLAKNIAAGEVLTVLRENLEEKLNRDDFSWLREKHGLKYPFRLYRSDMLASMKSAFEIQLAATSNETCRVALERLHASSERIRKSKEAKRLERETQKQKPRAKKQSEKEA